jgi:hypothetical protein
MIKKMLAMRMKDLKKKAECNCKEDVKRMDKVTKVKNKYG